MWNLGSEVRDERGCQDRIEFTHHFVGNMRGMIKIPMVPEQKGDEYLLCYGEEAVVTLFTIGITGKPRVSLLEGHTDGVLGVHLREIPGGGQYDVLTWSANRNIAYFRQTSAPGEKPAYKTIIIEPESSLVTLKKLVTFDVIGQYNRDVVGIVGITTFHIWVWLLDLKTGRASNIKSVNYLQGNDAQASVEVLSPNGPGTDPVAVINGAYGIRVVALPSLNQLSVQSHGGPCWHLAVLNSRAVITAGSTGKVKTWGFKGETPKLLFGGSHDGGMITGAVNGLRPISHSIFASWAKDNCIIIWDADMRSNRRYVGHHSMPSGVVCALKPELGVTFMASWSNEEDKMYLWDLKASGSVNDRPVWSAAFDSPIANVEMDVYQSQFLRILVSSVDGSVTHSALPIAALKS